MLTAILALTMVGIPSTVAGHPIAPAMTPLLVDNFTQDSQLNGTLWQVNGNNVVNAAKQMYTGTVVTPSTSFSSTRGLEMSGVTKAYELAGIGSLHSFLPPFIANVTVMGTDSHGAAFLLVLTNGTATSWVAVDGYLNSSEGSAYGIGLDARSPDWTRWAYLGNLVSSPALDLWYDITVAVSLSGVATVGVASGGASLGTMQVNVGTGPFVLGLMQAENDPPIVGNNVADWATASVLSAPVPGTYDVTFTEAGLPVGTSWSVTLNGTNQPSVGSTLTFAEPNGTYPFSVGTVAGYTASPSSGSVNVNGSSAVKTITFTSSTTPGNRSSPPSTLLGLPRVEGYALLGGIVALAIAGLAAGVLRGRRGRSPPPASGGGPG